MATLGPAHKVKAKVLPLLIVDRWALNESWLVQSLVSAAVSWAVKIGYIMHRGGHLTTVVITRQTSVESPHNSPDLIPVLRLRPAAM